LRVFLLEEDGLKQTCVYCIDRIKYLSLSILYCMKCIYQSAKNINPQSIRTVAESKLFRYSVLSCIVLYIYARVLSYMHEWLHAGPMVFILTLLVLLYTIGLGENTGAASGVPSAYSVFNRGVQRLLGQEDAETLANQFVNAAAGRGLDAVGVAGRNNARGVGRIWVGDDEVLEHDAENEQDVVQERRRRRRLERLQQRNNAEDGEPEIPRNNDNILLVDDIDDEADLEPEGELQNNADINRSARKSGKKARRRNLELRREMQRQRQAAAALGFGVDDLGEMNAMDQLIDN
jgi:hypothetical protein